jgi:DNA polymerase III subunit gamma/tau
MKTVLPWATKYRPLHFEDIVGQTNVVARLQGALKRGNLPNALLLTGPSGTGKTTLARMFARYINCKTHNACGKCASCLAEKHPDIDESNSAEARGIDEVRALIAKAKYRPQHNVRVFIIDEAHQMTPQALQAFLKPLEEPPKNTMYILCTTDPQKFPNTVVNRCLQLQLGLPSSDDVAARLRHIVKTEKVKVPKSLCSAIADATGGFIREAVNALENSVNLLETKPDIPEEELISIVSSTGNSETAAISSRILLGMYLSKPAVIAKAVFDMQDATQTVNQALWFNEYYLAQTLNHDTRAVFHSPANRAFAAQAKKRAPEVKVTNILDAQRKLVALRNQMHTVSTKEVSLMLAALT